VSSDDRVSRRGALVGIGLAAAGAASVVPRLAEGAVGKRPASREPELPRERPSPAEAHDLRPADDAVRALFGPLREGALVEGARIEVIHAVRAGAIPVVLSTAEGNRFAVEVFRLDLASPALAPAGPLAVYLVNRGDGRRSTPEPVGLGARALARALERRVAGGAPVPDALTTQRERSARHPAGIFHVPV
jgi:hypothetical protein